MASSCSRKTPSLTDAAMTDWAKCLCFDRNGQFNPNPFDDNASSCYNSMTSSKTVHGKEFSNTYIDFCSKNVDAGPTTSSSGVSNLLRSLQKGYTGTNSRHSAHHNRKLRQLHQLQCLTRIKGNSRFSSHRQLKPHPIPIIPAEYRHSFWFYLADGSRQYRCCCACEEDFLDGEFPSTPLNLLALLTLSRSR